MAAKKKAARKKASGAARGGDKAHAEAVAERNKQNDAVVLEQIRDAATGVHQEILKQHKPDLAFPVRSLKNVTYSA
ncbi:MAG TPA: hypothetical protein VMS55_07470, partial [Myxococcota bacterium]|nr:hypothetical protein [Myxococcota bacterium]